MFKVNYFYIVLSALFVTTTTTSIATADNVLKIAVVDMRKIDSDSLAAQDARKKFSNKEVAVQEALMKRKKDVENEYKSLESQRAMLTSATLNEKEQKLNNEYQKLQLDSSFYAEVFALCRSYIYDAIRDNIGLATKAVVNSKKVGYSLVVFQDSVVYFDKNTVTDITSDVVSKMNSIFKTVNFEQNYERAKKDLSKKFYNR